jgi:hypothetical protein
MAMVAFLFLFFVLGICDGFSLDTRDSTGDLCEATSQSGNSNHLLGS